ncbi:MAG: alkaline phosphatase family protein [Acidimicrobiales bacterium]
MSNSRRAKGRFRAAMGALTTGLLATAALVPATVVTATPASATGVGAIAGLSAGSIQHVWLIILENKSYDETFTGLNNNTYLWQTLPSEGVLLQNYYGTGHSSMDNYISLVSGQAPEEDTQEDCSTANVPFGSDSTIVTAAADIAAGGTGTVGGATPNWNFGQVDSLLGPNAPLGATGTTTTNGCTYPSEVATLFDQFNLAGISWKGYAQDLGGAQLIGSTTFVNDSVPGRDDGPCGAPGASTENPVTAPTYLTANTAHPLPSDVSSFTAASLVAGTGATNDPQ